MTVAAQTPTISYVEDGSTTAFPVPFRYDSPADLRATRLLADGTTVELANGTAFTATPGPTNAGGTVTLTAAGPSGAKLTIFRSTARSQAADYIANGAFTADSHERALDKAMLVAQEQDVALDRAVKAPVGESGLAMPPRAALQGKALAVEGDKIVGLDALSTIQAVAEEVTENAAASATAAEGFRNEAEEFRGEAEGFRNQSAINASDSKEARDVAVAAVAAGVPDYLPVSTAIARTLDDLPDGAAIWITDQYGGSWWRARDVAQVIPGQTSTNYTFVDEMTFYRTISGKPFIFDVDLNINLLRDLERANYLAWFTAQRRRDQAQHIAMYGDSLVYSQAGVSAAGATNRIGEATGYGDGSTHNFWQFDQHIPKELSDGLNEVRAGGVTVHNRGFSGDTAVAMYLRHRSPPTAGVSIIWPSGINDTNLATSNGATLAGLATNATRGTAAYREAVRRFAAREILRGNAIVLMSGPNFASATLGWDGTGHSATRAARAYETALGLVADELGVHFINTRRELLDQYFIYDIQSDGAHFKPTGTKVVGRRLAALFAGEGWRGVRRVSPGSVLIASDATQDILSEALTPVTVNVSPQSGGPGLISANPTTLAVTNGDPIMLSFYAETDDMICYVNGKAIDSTVTIELDGGAVQQDYKSALSAGKTPQVAGTPADSTLSRTYTGTHLLNRSAKRWGAADFLAIHVVGRGYHTLTISNGGANTVQFDGLEFQAWENERTLPPQEIGRTTDSAARNNTTAFAADDILRLPVLPNKIYKLEAEIRYNSPATPAFKWYIFGPTGWTARGTKGGTTPVDETNFAVTVDESGSANIRVLKISATITTGSVVTGGLVPGFIGLAWAPNVSDASNTSVLAGSWLRMTEIP